MNKLSTKLCHFSNNVLNTCMHLLCQKKLPEPLNLKIKTMAEIYDSKLHQLMNGVPLTLGPKLSVPALSFTRRRKKSYVVNYLQNADNLAWALNRVNLLTKAQPKKYNTKGTNYFGNNNNQYSYMVAPYYKGLIESHKRTCSKHGGTSLL